MSLHPRSGEQVPSLTAKIARVINPGGTTEIWVRDRLDGLWCDEDFAGWYPRDGRPGISPAQLATVCVSVSPWVPGGFMQQAGMGRVQRGNPAGQTGDDGARSAATRRHVSAGSAVAVQVTQEPCAEPPACRRRLGGAGPPSPAARASAPGPAELIALPLRGYSSNSARNKILGTGFPSGEGHLSAMHRRSGWARARRDPFSVSLSFHIASRQTVDGWSQDSVSAGQKGA
ncbi:hypothetical protein GCM10009665_39450 [Kitasatospora nipponensis]|uniref:Uncharacterized protein n=1 Tax=Kitasatospora nipponensis TaxID=258049 RepID=A0ABN1WC21_9ACTN